MNRLIAIAINHYKDPQIPDLSNCVADVNAVIDILTQKYKFENIELFSSVESTTLTAIYYNLYDQIINAMPDDSLLIYFAGHGEYHPTIGGSYWMCSDSKKNNITSWFNISTLNDFLKVSPAKHIALISDSCFSGAIFETFRGGGFAALDSKVSRQALTSGGIEKVSDGEGQHSQFNLSIQKVLIANIKAMLTFNDFSEQVILDFDAGAIQTPIFGALTGSGHRGGSFSFALQAPSTDVTYQDLQLSLDLPQEVQITSNIKVPFFNQNSRFSNTFINGLIQSLGHSIIKDAREFVQQDLDWAIESSGINGFELTVRYTIKYFDDKLLSIQFSNYSEMGAMHPNYYFYALNFAFSPDRWLALFNILSYEKHLNLKEYLKYLLSTYAEEDAREIVIGCLEEYDCHDLPYTFTETVLTIWFHNCLPHAFKALGEVNIPIKKIDIHAAKLHLG